MEGFLKQLKVLAAKLQNKVITDIFTSARLRITLLYFFIGVLVFGAAGILTYRQTIRIFHEFTRDLQSAVTNSLQEALGPASSATNTTIPETATGSLQSGRMIAEVTELQIKQMIYATFFWMLLVLLGSSYLLAGITLRPIRRTLENKKRFVANVSHELRTPLSVMKTVSETALLDEKNLNKQEIAEALKSNLEEIDRMSNILRFLFTFSNLEHLRQKLPMAPVNLLEIAEKAVRALRVQIDTKKINLEIWKDSGVFVWGSAVALEEILMNLLKNSVRHTPEEGDIRIILERKLYGVVRLVVKDSGSGISEEDLQHAFEPFYKGSGKTQGKENVGLGLAITKEIVALHRGSISIESKLNQGTVVEIILPAAAEPEEA